MLNNLTMSNYSNSKLFLASAAFAALALTSCHNDKEHNDILHPISQHLVGMWKQSYSQMQGDNGQWNPSNDVPGYAYTYTFRADGKVIVTRTVPEGWQQMQCGTWEADEQKNGFTLSAKGSSQFSQLERLAADEYSVLAEYGAEDGSTVPIHRPFRFVYARQSEATFVEQFAGKWVYQGSWQKIDGEWKQIDFAVPDEAWFDLGEDGLCTAHSKQGDQVQDATGLKWSVNINTTPMKLRLEKDGQSTEQNLILVSPDKYEGFYTTNTDHFTGETRTGEFKDVYVREK